MTDNRWQIGIAGNYTNEDDEKVRKAILDVQKEFGYSGSEAAKWLILQVNANAHLQEAEPMRELTANAPTVQVDNSEIIEALQLMLEALQIMRESNEIGLARVVDKLDNITIAPVSAPQRVDYDVQNAEDQLLDTGMTPAALTALKTKVFKPGRRLETKQ